MLGGDVTRMSRAEARAAGACAHVPAVPPVRRAVTVEDSIYLSILGVGDGHLRPVVLPRKDKAIREQAREAARRVAIDHKLDSHVGDLSHGEHRQVALAMALAAEPKLLMLDEPAVGALSRRAQAADRSAARARSGITLILIEHDMDVALVVAERVTMMHDGRVIVEGTPAEIRANTLVHDLYLGRVTTTEHE